MDNFLLGFPEAPEPLIPRPSRLASYESDCPGVMESGGRQLLDLVSYL